MNCSSRKRKKRKMRIKMPLFLLECWNFTSHCTSNSVLDKWIWNQSSLGVVYHKEFLKSNSLTKAQFQSIKKSKIVLMKSFIFKTMEGWERERELRIKEYFEISKFIFFIKLNKFLWILLSCINFRVFEKNTENS